MVIPLSGLYVGSRCFYPAESLCRDGCTDKVAAGCADDALLSLEREDPHFHAVVPGQDRRGHIDCLQVLFHDLFISEMVIAFGVRVFARIRIIYAVDIGACQLFKKGQEYKALKAQYLPEVTYKEFYSLYEAMPDNFFFREGKKGEKEFHRKTV